MTIYIFYFIIIQIILLIPSFFLYRFIFRKIGVHSYRSYAYMATIFLPFLFTVLFAILNSVVIYPHIRSEKFNAYKWNGNDQLRYTMVNDIINSRLLIGKTKEEVMGMLGHKTDEGPCNTCMGYSTYEPDQGFSIDHQVLEIDFDKQNRVTSVMLNAW